jgi:hypothetical protein
MLNRAAQPVMESDEMLTRDGRFPCGRPQCAPRDASAPGNNLRPIPSGRFYILVSKMTEKAHA